VSPACAFRRTLGVGLAALLLPLAVPAAEGVRSPPGAARPAATPAPPPAADECRPGLGASVDVSDLAQRLAERRPLGAPRNASLAGVVDRTLLCPGVADGLPCLTPGPIVLACVRLGLPVDLQDVVVTGGLDLGGASLHAGFVLQDVAILGPLSLNLATVAAEVRLERVLVAGEARLDFATFKEPVVLRDVRIAGPLTLQGSNLTKDLVLT
jgi:hypothetical protein